MSNDQPPPENPNPGEPAQPDPSAGTPPPSGDAPPPPPPAGGGYGTPPPPPPTEGGYGTPPPPPNAYGQPAPGGYSIGNAFSWGWSKFQANLGPILIAAVALVAATIVIQVIGNVVSSALVSSPRLEFDPNTGQLTGTGGGGFFGLAMFLSLGFSALSYAVSLFIQAGIIRAALDIAEGRTVDLKEMFTRFDFVQVIIASVIIGALMFVGLILCVLPGIAVMFFSWFTLWFVVGKQMSAIDALKASFDFVKNNAGTLILFFLASLAAYFVGLLACLIGILVAIPVVILAQAYTFKTLQGEPVAP